MERLKSMKESLIAAVQGQIGNLANADTKELGEAVDMIKDLEEAIYYCSITKAMEESKEEEKYREKYQRQTPHYYTERYIPMDYYRDMDREGLRRMYYPERDSQGRFTGGGRGGNYNSSSSGNSGGGARYYTSPYDEYEMYPMEIRDIKEGKSPLTRKTYMEGKELHRGKESQMKELEKYVQELGKDITEMISDASVEEKQLLQQKISALATKIK